MTDSDSKKEGISTWQKQSTEEEEPKEISRIEQAKRFLEADEVRTSSPSKQASFLKTKGFSEEEIGVLLGTDWNNEVPPETSPKNISPPPQKEDTPPSSANHPQQMNPIHQDSQPPIITYPEFLTKPTGPSPLLTSTRLLTTLTLFSSISLLLHGTNKYLLTPMQETLSQSRHELLSLASTHLSTLNERLGEAVSEQPVLGMKKGSEMEDEDSDGDPTEMFHRDIGIQTSPSLLASSPSHSRPSSPTTSKTTDILESQLDRLSIISSHLNELHDTSKSEGTDATELTTTIDVLREYLENMAFTPPTYSFGSQGYSGMVRDMVGGEGGKEELDEIAKVRAGIRGVKGVLLSARSFPRGVGVGGWGGAYT